MYNQHELCHLAPTVTSPKLAIKVSELEEAAMSFAKSLNIPNKAIRHWLSVTLVSAKCELKTKSCNLI